MSDSVSCTHLENYQVQVRTKNRSWIADEPPEIGGDDLGASPFEMLLGSLGACTTITVYHYATQAKIPLEKIWVDLEGKWDEDKKYSVEMTLRVRGDLGEKDIERLKRAAGLCPVHKILSQAITIKCEIQKV